MNIKWYGHASFRITSANGTSLITDPYTPERTGYRPISESSDLVVISSATDSFHCRADLISGNPSIINALDLAQNGQIHTEKGIGIRAIAAMEALAHRDYHPDQNAMYRIEMDGRHIGHMGDMGNPLSAEQTNFFAGIDILLALTGGYPTILLDDLKTFIDAIKPKLIIPMHFRTLRYKPQNILWLESFLRYFEASQLEFACTEEVEIFPSTLPTTTRVMVLDYL